MIFLYKGGKMKKALLLIAIIGLMMPVMAESATTQTRQFVPITEAMDKARIQREADIRAGKATLQEQRTEIQNKVDAQKEAYEKQQAEYAKKRAEFKKQNEAKKQQIKKSIDSSIQRVNMNADYEYRVSDTVYIDQDNAGTPKRIRDDNAIDFTQLKNYVNGKEIEAE